MKILILGHNGLLGNMVYLYFRSKNYNTIITNLRWDDEDFKNFVIDSKPDYIINCIGIIPQRKPNDDLYYKVNYELPLWLDTLGIKVIHPDTDEPDDTPYGKSKKMAREKSTMNTKIIKTSILGFEKGTKFSFLEWFLHSENTVSGFTNQFWNGNTTLVWAKFAEKIILNWESFRDISILSNPTCQSKFTILMKIKDIFQKEIEIVPTEAGITKNNCLSGNFICDDISLQIEEMKHFYENQN